MKSSSPREYVILALCAAFFIAALAAPIYVFIRTKSAERYVDDIESKLGSARSREVQTRSVKQLLADTATQREMLEEASLPKEGAAVLIDLLERDARAANIAFEIGSVSVDPKDGPLDSLQISMQGGGSFSAVMRLVALVGSVPYASTVDSVVLERSDTSRWTATIGTSVAMRKDI